jgi:glycine cleavage system aminomethyltransferase T
VRNRAVLFDVSALKIVNVSGPGALDFLNYLLT